MPAILFAATAPQDRPVVELSTEPAEILRSEQRPPPNETLLKESGRTRLTEPTRDAYTLVIDAVLALLTEPQVDEWLAEKMDVRKAQMKDWLDRGVREGRILKLKKPARYAAQTPNLFTD